MSQRTDVACRCQPGRVVKGQSASANRVPALLPYQRPPLRETYEHRLSAMREAPTVTPTGIARRVRLNGFKFSPEGHCVLCGERFHICQHTQQENEWAIAVVHYNFICL